MPAHRRLLVFLVASLALSAVASACGQAKEPTKTLSVAERPARDVVMTKHEFIARADAICERMNAQSVAAATQLRGRPVEEMLARALSIQGTAIRGLRALERPPGDEKQIEEVLRHMQRLQEVSRMLDTEGEEILGVVAGIAVETDAVARAAKRYGLFRKCAAYRELPDVQRILHGEKPSPGLERGPDGKPVLPAILLRPPVRGPGRPPLGELRELANRLIPPGRRVVRRIDCTGDRGVVCFVIELDPGEAPLGTRQAEIGRLARRAGWKLIAASGGESPLGMVQLRRGDDQASIRLVSPPCEQIGDAPDRSRPVPTRCVDTIMLLRVDS